MVELNTIYNEDCLEGMKRIPDGSVDLIVTDPPYLVNYKTGYRKDKNHRFNRVILNDDNEQLITDYIEECYRIMKMIRQCICFVHLVKWTFSKVN